MVRPPPISLRIRRNAAATSSARKLLRRLDNNDHLQRRVRWQAMKAVVSIREMMSIAAMLPAGDSVSWRRQFEQVQSLLEKVAKRGV
jgi:hypothetical protein